MNDQSDITGLRDNLPPFSLAYSEEALLAHDQYYRHYWKYYGLSSLSGFIETSQVGLVQIGMRRVAVHRWSVANARASVVVTHGLFDHVGLYAPLFHFLLSHQCNVLTFDLPEHGLSSGEYGELDTFDIYGDCLHGVLQQALMPRALPLVLLGQSTGAATIHNYLERYREHVPEQLSRLIFLAPLLRSIGWKRITWSYAFLRCLLKRVPRDFASSSHDTAFCDFLKNEDPFQPRYIAVNWVKAMLDWAARFEHIHSNTLKGVIIQGNADMTVNADYNLPKIKEKYTNLNVVRIEGARHHLVRESEHLSAQVFQAVGDCLNAVWRQSK